MHPLVKKSSGTRSVPRQRPSRRLRRSPLGLLLLLLIWSLVLGFGLAQATTPSTALAQATTPPPVLAQTAPPSIGTVDVVPQNLQLGQQLYLQNCATCHYAPPPAVLPTQTWARILEQTDHYGTQITLPQDPGRLLIWNYLRNFSRPLKEGEDLPLRFDQSRFFNALHPRVELPRPSSFGTCISCHPSAQDYNFRSLSPQWENAP